jgi:hypothetical protein
MTRRHLKGVGAGPDLAARQLGEYLLKGHAVTRRPERSVLQEKRTLVLAGDARYHQFASVPSRLECARDRGSLADAEPAKVIIGHGS